MGIQCRLIINLVTLPIRPSQNDLCSLKQKKSENSTSKQKSNTNKNDKNKNTKKKINKKNKNSSDEDESSYDFSDEDIDDDNNETQKNKMKRITRKTRNEKNENTTKKQQPSVSKDHQYNEQIKSSTDKSSKSSIKNTNKKINFDKLKTSTDNDDKNTQKTGTKTKKIHLDKLKSPLKKSSENSNQITKRKTDIDQDIKSNSRKSTRKSTKLDVDQLASGSSVNNKNDKNPVITNPQKNVKIKKNKSPLSDEDNSRSTSKSSKVQNQKKSSDTPKLSVTSKTIKSTVQNVNRRQTRARSRANDDDNEEKLVIPQMDGADDAIDIKKRSKRSSATNNRESIDNNKKENVRRNVNLKKLQVPDERKNSLVKSDSDDEFVPLKKSHKTNKSQLGSFSGGKVIDRRVLSTDEEDENDDDNKNKTKRNDEKQKNKKNMDIWIEVFSETEDQWITIDLFKSKVHCVDSIRKSATSPVAYVFAWNNDNTLKDVSPRYCPQWNTTTRKLRVDQEWLDEAIENYLGKATSRDIAEDRELQKMHLDKPLPTVISEYKNHPLYVLRRHLLKFEVIYPPNALTLGFVRGEPVYSRSCVHVCHSRDIWLKSARVIKPGEEPYKIVKSRPKWDRMSQTVIKDQPLEIFGYWQTKQYDPPTAENGIVPRNAYGNVELFKKCMLPKKTVHLQLPGLNRICKKLNIDCAPAVIGFDFHQGVCHPLLDGFVVCEEFKDTVIEAWHKDKEEAERKEREKYLQRVYGNWKKLIRGMLIKQKLKIKYNF